MMLTLGASLGSLAAAWAAGNTKASAVFRPGEQPVLEGVQGVQEREQVLEDEEDELEEGVYDLVELKGDDEVSSDEEVVDKENKESPPKRLRRSRKKK
jgi:hypothetical protein